MDGYKRKIFIYNSVKPDKNRTWFMETYKKEKGVFFMGNLDGKIAVVTGSAQGIGYGSAKVLAQHGATVILVDFAEAVKDTAEELKQMGLKADWRRCDVSKLDEVQETVDDIESRLENDVNGGLIFHKISVESGYYSGVQFYVETTDDPTEMDNEDCRYYFDMYRSVAIRRYNSEVNKVCRILRKLAKEYGFDELYLRARFSNGEALYGRVENTSRAKLMQAVSPRV